MEEATLQLLDAYDQAETLGQIANLLWLIAALLLAIVILQALRLLRKSDSDSGDDSNWHEEVEQAYEKADYGTALNILETTALLFPGSALVRYWQGRCFFRMEDWEKAASTFEELLRIEPAYRQSVKDYMAFIELNGLVSGVEGYMENKN